MKKFFVFALLILLSAQIFAIDFGGKLSSNTRARGETFKKLKWSENASLHLWLSHLFDSKYKMKFSTDGSYEFRWDQVDNSKRHIIDLNLLKFSALFPLAKNVSLDFAIGRFPVVDTTGIIFNQINDGVYTKFNFTRAQLQLYLGISRILNANDIVMFTETATTSVPIEKYKYPYVLNAKYIPLALSVYAPSLFANQNLTFEFWGVFDYSKEKYNRMYGTLALAGPLAGPLFYNVSTTFGSEKFKNVSNLTSFVLSYFPVPEALLSFQTLYASGFNGKLSAFRGVTSREALFATGGKNFNLEYSGKLLLSLQASYTFIQALQLSGKATAVFACPKDKVSYDGFEGRIDVLCSVLRDLQLGAGLYGYISQNKEHNKVGLSINASLAF